MATPLEAPFVMTRYDLFSQIIADCPRAAELLTDYGLHCSNCFLNEYDSVEVGVARHNMTEAEMVEMIDEINEQLALEWDEQQAAANEKAKTN